MPRRKNGQTPLHEAALGGFVDCVKLLLEAAGRDRQQLIEAVDNEGNTALNLAVNNIPAREAVAEILREAAQ
jgi:ankyrin repeat protein